MVDLFVNGNISVAVSWFRLEYREWGRQVVVFVDPGAKINSAYYCKVVLGKGLLPDIEAKCGRHKWTLQQDGAPAHTARNTNGVPGEREDRFHRA